VAEIEQVRSTFNELCDIVNQQKCEREKLTKTDKLTGIANRRAFDNELERNWNHLGHYGGHCALILCDLDFLKLFNDHYGHLTLSLGISTLAVKEDELLKQHSKDWVKQADDALYEAKEQGRNQYIIRPFVFTD
jgi:PleD family two-component response regulator